MSIHKTAIVHENARVAKGVSIGAYSVIDEDVELASGCVIHPHVCISGETKIGENTTIFPFASIGYKPQDLKYQGEKSRVIIGKNNTIREYVTIHPGTADDRMETIIGDECLFMISAHVAHDCVVGNRVIMANNATLAGHVSVGDGAIIGGLSAVRQHVRVGKNAIIGGMSGVENDVIPYGNAFAERARLNGLNIVGLKRAGHQKSEIQELREAYDYIFLDNKNTLAKRVEDTKIKYAGNSLVNDVVSFIEDDKTKAICVPEKQQL